MIAGNVGIGRHNLFVFGYLWVLALLCAMRTDRGAIVAAFECAATRHSELLLNLRRRHEMIKESVSWEGMGRDCSNGNQRARHRVVNGRCENKELH